MPRARTPEVGDFPIRWTPDLRARYDALLPYYPWLAEVNEAYQFYMASTSLYRAAYVSPLTHHVDRPVAAPWRAVEKAAIDAWRARDLPERWATSDGTAQALTWLEQTFRLTGVCR